MNFSDAGYMFTNHIYELSEENRMNRIRRMQQMLEAEKVDFALFIGRGFSGIATWFTGLPNPEFPDAGNGAFILPVQGELIDVGGNALLTEEYLKTLKTYDVIQPPHAEVAHLIGMASGGINAGIQPAAPVGEGGKNLGAIVPRIFHADDGQCVRKKLHKRGLLVFEVFAIGDGQLDAAAAAAFREGTFHW